MHLVTSCKKPSPETKSALHCLWQILHDMMLFTVCSDLTTRVVLQISADDVQRFVMTLHLKLSHGR